MKPKTATSIRSAAPVAVAAAPSPALVAVRAVASLSDAERLASRETDLEAKLESVRAEIKSVDRETLEATVIDAAMTCAYMRDRSDREGARARAYVAQIEDELVVQKGRSNNLEAQLAEAESTIAALKERLVSVSTEEKPEPDAFEGVEATK